MQDFTFDRICAKIDLDAIIYNAKNIREKLPKDTEFFAVIKADGYGHGARVLANCYGDIIDGVCVAGVSEALELRKTIGKGENLYEKPFEKPILVLGYTNPDFYEKAILNNITLTVFDEKSATDISQKAMWLNRVCNVNIAVDTGMRRIGFAPEYENAEAIKHISWLSNVKITGVFSHLAKADEENPAATRLQLRRFKDFIKMLENEDIDVGKRHIANSAFVMNGTEKFDAARPGIILYGCYPSEEVDKTLLDIKKAMTLESRVVNVFTLKRGEGIGYGHTFIADRDLQVATISAGYADGIFRSLSNKGSVLIHGKRAKIVGRICMDQFMVDVSQIPGVCVGDAAVIFGEMEFNGKKYELPVEEVAELAGSFNYEMLCAVSMRVPRIYYEGGKPILKVDYLE